MTIAYCDIFKAEHKCEYFYGQATKGVRWMPWCRKAMKDVVSCDKLWGAAKQALIQRFLNGETLFASWRIIHD